MLASVMCPSVRRAGVGVGLGEGVAVLADVGLEVGVDVCVAGATGVGLVVGVAVADNAGVDVATLDAWYVTTSLGRRPIVPSSALAKDGNSPERVDEPRSNTP
jgi:hypothetical protein